MMKQIKEALQLIGNQDLKDRIDEASTKLYRGIAFTSSLYI